MVWSWLLNFCSTSNNGGGNNGGGIVVGGKSSASFVKISLVTLICAGFLVWQL